MKENNFIKNGIERVNIIGVPISATNINDTIRYLLKNWNNIKGNYICVSNVHTTVEAYENIDYHKVQSESLLSLPDGKPLSLLGRKFYPEMDRVTGPDFMRAVFEISKERKFRHFFYGSTEENLKILVEKLQELYPFLEIVGFESSVFRDMTEEEEDLLFKRINEVNPDFLWIALGAPRQEYFCYRNRNKINGVMVGVGGAFNVLSGIIPEAPNWMKRLSLEWLFRLIQEPKRLFKRYLFTNTKFIYYYIKYHNKHRNYK